MNFQDFSDRKKDQKDPEKHIRIEFIVWVVATALIFFVFIFPLTENFLIAINGTETTGTIASVRPTTIPIPTSSRNRFGGTRMARLRFNTIRVEYFTGETMRDVSLRTATPARVGDTITLIYSPQNPTSVTTHSARFSMSFIILLVGVVVGTFFMVLRNED